MKLLPRDKRKYAMTVDEAFPRYKRDPEYRRRVDSRVRYYEMLMSLRATREKEGLTQEQLAEKSGIPLRQSPR